MMEALKVLILGGGQFGTVTPEHNRHALHGHVVHLIEETPQCLARHHQRHHQAPASCQARHLDRIVSTAYTQEEICSP